MDRFYLCWVIVGSALLGIAVLAGLRSESKSVIGILIDERGRCSLNRLQLVMWTLLIFSTLLALACSSAGFELAAIPDTYLPLLGISAATGVVAGAVKAGKELDPTVVVQRRGEVAESAGKLVAPQEATPSSVKTTRIRWHFGQMFLEEEGQGMDKVVSVTKFQGFILTIALGIWFVVSVVAQGTFPKMTDDVLYLLGISHAAYVGGKVPKRA